MIPGGDRVAVRIVNTQPEHVPALAAMQRLVFPTLVDDELLTEAKYSRHLEIFPRGQFVALIDAADGPIVVGGTTTFRTHFDAEHLRLPYLDIIAGGWLTNHQPHGPWLYGVDMSVHPAWRGRRIGRRLYEARQQLVYELNLRGELASGMLPGYYYHRAGLTVPQYVLRVKQGHLYDPTLTMQLKNGFRVRGILYDHISDPRSNNCASLIVRENPHYRPPRRTREEPRTTPFPFRHEGTRADRGISRQV